MKTLSAILILLSTSAFAADAKCKITLAADGANTAQASAVQGMAAQLEAMGCDVNYRTSSSGGTYTLSAGANPYNNQCANVPLVFTENADAVTATGSNGSCSVSLQGTKSNGSLIVTSYISSQIPTQGYSTEYPLTCSYTGTIIMNNNSFTGTLTATNAKYTYFGPQCPAITLNGTKSN